MKSYGACLILLVCPLGVFAQVPYGYYPVVPVYYPDPNLYYPYPVQQVWAPMPAAPMYMPTPAGKVYYGGAMTTRGIVPVRKYFAGLNRDAYQQEAMRQRQAPGTDLPAPAPVASRPPLPEATVAATTPTPPTQAASTTPQAPADAYLLNRLLEPNLGPILDP